MKALEEEPVRVKKVLEVLKQRDKEKMTYEQRMALEASKKQIKTLDDKEKVIQELKDLDIRRLEKRTIYRLVEILPRTMTEIRAMASNTDLRDKELKQILKIIKKYVKEEK